VSKVLTCTEFDAASQQCITQSWLDPAPWTSFLPTIDQAAYVGSAYFIGLMTLAVVRGLLNPKSIED